MNQRELYTVFKSVLKWQGQRISFLILFVISLVKVRTLNLSHVSEGFETKSEVLSNYRRIQRFLKDFVLEPDVIARLISRFLADKKWVICMDRTEWKFGKIWINLLFLSVAVKGVSIPLFVNILSKKGISNLEERKDIITKFIKVFGIEKISFLTCDREFIGKKWFKWLMDKNVVFHIRIKENSLIPNSKGQLKHASCFFSQLNSVRTISKPLYGIKLNLLGTLLSDGEYLIVATNSNQPTLNDYGKRWKIELMFSAFKKRGFNFEDTKITEPDKLEKLVALLSIAFCWCYAVGEVRNQEKPIKFREDLGTFAVSIFHYGCEFIRTSLLNPIHKFDSLKLAFRVLLSYILHLRTFVME